MKDKKLLSFLILTYRHFDGIYETLDSLFEQDYPEIEIVISDDGSPNYKEEIVPIKEYIESHKSENIKNVIYNHLEPNQGTVQNINSAIKCSNGFYIKDLGADDTLATKDALTRFVGFLEESDVEICFAKVMGILDDGTKVPHLAACEEDYDLLKSLTPMQMRDRLFVRNFLPAPAWMAKRTLFEKYGFYPVKTRLIEDYPYWITLCNQNVRFGFLDEVLVIYKQNGISSAGSYSKAFMDDMFVIYNHYIFPYDKRFGVFQPFYNWLKKMGLNTYVAKAEWDEYHMWKKILAYVKYGPFFFYIWLGNQKYKKLNESK